MAYCIYCGTKNRDEALFCKNCGKPMAKPESVENKVEEPVAQEPVVQEPVVQEPVVQEPIVEEPVVPEPVVQEPVVQQPVVQQPVVQQPVVPEPVVQEPVVQQPVAQEPPKPSVSSTVDISKPKHKKLITFMILLPIIALVLALIGGAIFLFVASRNIKDEMANTMEVINHENEETQKDDDSQIDMTAVGEDVSDEAEEAEVAEEAEAVDENTAEAVAPTATSAASLSTRARPTLADFQGWFINGAMKRGRPAGVKLLSDISEISGSWKAFLFLDPSNKYDCKAHTLGTITIEGTNERPKFYLKRYSTHFFSDNETLNESDEAPDAFSGRWAAGKLNASGVGSFTITAFWEQDGKQYAIGTFSAQDGIPASMAMVRP